MPVAKFSRHSGSSPAEIFNIGDVLAQLQREFPAVTASKIRFFEDKGLVTPQRTAAGYRQFTINDVERLQFILTLQRDHYLPLKVIRDYLESIDRGEGPENLAVPLPASMQQRISSETQPGDSSTREAVAKSRPRRYSAQQLRAEAGASVDFFRTLSSFGLIVAKNGYYDEHDLKVVKTCVVLANHGIEARHLRPFQVAADRELDLVERVVNVKNSNRNAQSRVKATQAAQEISELCLELHAALVRGRISQI